MPGNLNAAVPIGTLPFSLCTKFSESHSVQMNINRYRDNSTQRQSLVVGGRRRWAISKRLTAADLGILRDFFFNAHGGAFYFYNPCETSPPYSRNPIGTQGRYLVRFNSDWSQTNGSGRIDAGIELIEVA